MQQLAGGTNYTTNSPTNVVTAANLDALVAAGTLTNGAVIDQSDVSTRAGNVLPLAADRVLLGDSTNPDTAPPLSVALSGLLLQSQRDGTQRWGGVAGGTANALTLATTPVSSGAYVSGELIRFKTAGAANTGAVTLNLDGRGVVNLYNISAAALVAGDLPANAVVEAVYDGTEFQVVSLAVPLKYLTSYQAAEKLRGDCQQYATAAGTANAITIAPLDSSGAAAFTALYDGMVVRFKAASANTGAVTLAVNGLGTPALVGPTGAALAAGVITAGQILECVYDLANTRFMVISQLSATWSYVSALTAVPAPMTAVVSGLAQFAHGFGVAPTKYKVFLQLVTAVVAGVTSANMGVAVGDLIDIANLTDNAPRPVFDVAVDATNINVTRTPSANCYLLPRSGNATYSGVQDIAAWLSSGSAKLLVYASL